MLDEKSTPLAPTVVTTQGNRRGGIRQQEVIIAIVESVDARNRTVTLRGPDGTTETIRVPEEARNSQGRGAMRSSRPLPVRRLRCREEERSPARGDHEEGGAGPSWREAGRRARVVTIVADVVTDRRAGGRAQGPEGKTTTVNVQNPVAFDRVKVGDRVEIA
jgi:hypothetical protein